MAITVHTSRRGADPAPLCLAAERLGGRAPREPSVLERYGIRRRPPFGRSAWLSALALAGIGCFATFSLVEAGHASATTGTPCAPIHWVFNPRHAPASGPAEVRRAFARLSSASGLRFVYDGRTDEVPSDARPAAVTAPLLVAWAPSGGGISWRDGDLGKAFGNWIPTGGVSRFVSGFVYVNADASPASVPRLLLHELGHVVGLGHSTFEGDVMYPANLPGPASYSEDDRARLAIVGENAGC